jgi:hypothetical protein
MTTVVRAARRCAQCQAGVTTWICWHSWRGDPHYFCDNECLAQWLMDRRRAAIRRSVPALHHEETVCGKKARL